MTANEPTLLPVRPGTLTPNDKAKLSKIGIIVIEHENPAELRLLKPCADISGNVLLIAALEALNSTTANGYLSNAQVQFAKTISRAIIKRAGDERG